MRAILRFSAFAGVLASSPLLAQDPNTVTTLPDPTPAKPLLIMGMGSGAPNWLILIGRTNCPSSDITNANLDLTQGTWGTNAPPTATYCRGRLVYYMGMMPWTEFRAKMNQGVVRINGKPAPDYTSGDAYHYSIDGIKSVFREFESRDMAAIARRDALQTASALAKPVVPGGPSPTDILSAAARSGTKYDVSILTDVPGEEAYRSPFGGIGYYFRRSISNVSCRRVTALKFTCTYDRTARYVAAPDSVWGSLAVVSLNLANTNSRQTQTMTKVGGVWTSPTMEAAAADRARRLSQQAASNTGHSSAADQNRAFEEQRSQCKKNLNETVVFGFSMANC